MPQKPYFHQQIRSPYFASQIHGKYGKSVAVNTSARGKYIIIILKFNAFFKIFKSWSTLLNKKHGNKSTKIKHILGTPN